MASRLEYRVLGPLEAARDGQVLDLGGPRQHRLLSALLLSPDLPVSGDRLIEAVWGSESAPDAADRTLPTYVSRLRNALGNADVIRKLPAGYALQLDGATIDADQFERLVGEARSLTSRDDPAAATSKLDAALALWRGDAFEGLADEPWVQATAVRLEELKLAAIEQLIDARLQLGLHADVVPELEALTRAHPLREHLLAQLALAQYRSGRQTEALRQLHAYRSYLADETGLEPGSELRELERGILTEDPELDAPAQDGQLLRGYVLGEEIGAGAFSIVYRAVQPGLGREVAMKVIRAELANQPRFVRQFEVEARTVARLEHPNIVPLYDFWREPDGAYLVMRWLRGGSLEDVIQKRRFTVDEALGMAEQVGSALEAAHAVGLVHRDVKPANVLVDAKGNHFLADFGLALAGPAERGATGYASPESRQEEVGPTADVYGLAATVAAVLAGGQQPPAPVMDAVAATPPEIQATMRRATAADPRSRPPTVTAFVDELRWTLDRPVPASATRQPLLRNPYKGLRAFDEADADDYFGRLGACRDIEDLLRDGSRFVVVVGPSGSGKSSLVRAGLVPRLRAGSIPGAEGWFVAAMAPGSDPFTQIDAALRAVAITQVPTIAEDPSGIQQAVDLALPDGAEALLVVDQYEELYIRTHEAARERFVEALLGAATSAGSRLRVVATLRADYYDRPLADPTNGEAIRAGTVPLAAITTTDLRDAIIGPARVAGGDVDEALTAALVSDVVHEQAALPLLQLTLAELFEDADDGRLTLDAYTAWGGLSGAIARRAEIVYSALDQDVQPVSRSLFGRLVTVADDGTATRRQARQSELTDATALVDAYGNARLLVFDRDATTREPTVEVAHEALLSEWPRLARWLEEDRDQIRTRRHLADAATSWHDGGRDPDELYRGARLESAVMLADVGDHDLDEIERAFVAEGRARAEAEVARSRRRTRILQGLLATVVLLLVGAVVAGLVALQQRNDAQDAENLATARRLEAEFDAALRDDFAAASLLAVEAFQRDPNLRATSNLQRTVTHLPGVISRRVDDAAFAGAAVDPQTSTLYVRDGAELRRYDPTTLEDVGEPATAPDLPGGVVPVPGRDVLLVPHPQGSELWVMPAGGGAGEVLHRAFFENVAVDPSGTTVAVHTAAGVVELVDIDSGDVVGSIELTGPASRAGALEFSPDGALLAVVTVSNEIAVVDVVSGNVVDRAGHIGGEQFVHDIDWSPDMRYLALAFIDGTNVLVDADTLQAIGEPITTAEFGVLRLDGVAFDPDSSMLAMAGSTVEIVTVPGLEPVGSFDPEIGPTGFVAFAAGRVVTSGPSGSIALMRLDGGGAISDPVADDAMLPAIAPSWDPDSASFVTNSNVAGGTVARIDAATLDQLVSVPSDVPGASAWGVHRVPGDDRLVTVHFRFCPPDGCGVELVVRDETTLTATAQLLVEDAPGSSPSPIAVHPDGSTIAVGTRGPGRVRLFSLPDLVEVDVLDVGDISVMSVAYSRQGDQILLTAADFAQLVTWDVSGPEPEELARADLSLGFFVTLADGSGLGGQQSGDLVTFDPATLELTGEPLQGHESYGTRYTDTADGRYLATSSQTEVRLWDFEARRLVGDRFPGGVDATISPDGRSMLTVSEMNIDFAAGIIERLTPNLRWTLDRDDWLGAACALAGRNLTADEWAGLFPGEDYRATCPQYPAGA